MSTGLLHRIDVRLEGILPERRLFLRSESDTRFVILKPTTQLVALIGGILLIAWTIVATAILLMDSIGSGNFRAQAERDQRTYQARLNAMAEERDGHAAAALAAQERFNSALGQISVMQSELLASEDRRRELETGIDVIQSTLRTTMAERDSARADLASLEASLSGEAGTERPAAARAAEAEATVALMSETLSRAAEARDEIVQSSESALAMADDILLDINLMEEQNDRIFRQLEEAMNISVEPLEQMFRNAGMDPDRLINQVRRGYNGEGGPMEPITFSTREGGTLTPDADRANRLLEQLDYLNLYRMAAEKLPFSSPVLGNYRYTSGYGYRRDPITGGRRLHAGSDFAAPKGTDIFATADGVVIYAGYSGSYGNLIKIQHDFGIETRYAHLSRIRVKKGQRVSRGDHIGDMGNTGRSTGTHLHYEVRAGGKTVNPMNYIKAGTNVF